MGTRTPHLNTHNMGELCDHQDAYAIKDWSHSCAAMVVSNWQVCSTPTRHVGSVDSATRVQDTAIVSASLLAAVQSSLLARYSNPSMHNGVSFNAGCESCWCASQERGTLFYRCTQLCSAGAHCLSVAFLQLRLDAAVQA
jgi:hypothetical protein